jgi:hypothetical protein
LSGLGLIERTPTMGEASATAEVFRRVIVEPAYKAVSAEIERAILGGALPLGAALPTEQELAERFGVHRSKCARRSGRSNRKGCCSAARADGCSSACLA